MKSCLGLLCVLLCFSYGIGNTETIISDNTVGGVVKIQVQLENIVEVDSDGIHASTYNFKDSDYSPYIVASSGTVSVFTHDGSKELMRLVDDPTNNYTQLLLPPQPIGDYPQIASTNHDGTGWNMSNTMISAIINKTGLFHFSSQRGGEFIGSWRKSSIYYPSITDEMTLKDGITWYNPTGSSPDEDRALMFSIALSTGIAVYRDYVEIPHTLKLPTGASDGYVLTSDADGDASWQEAASGGIGDEVIVDTITINNQLQMTTNGTYAKPAIAFTNDANGDTGINRNGENILSVIAGGSSVVNFRETYIQTTVPMDATAYKVGGVEGISCVFRASKTVDGSDCTVTVTNGLITATTCN